MSGADSIGICYGISGLPHLAQAIVSARSVKTWMRDIPIELHIDTDTFSQAQEQIDLHDTFDSVVHHYGVEHHRTLKFAALFHNRFEKALFLDSDTFVTDRFDELFVMLDRFELAATHAPQRFQPQVRKSGLYEAFSEIPTCFPEFNTGVIPFRNNDRTMTFLRNWVRIYDDCKSRFGVQMDQSSFRAALYETDLNFFVLTPEYNLRAHVPMGITGKVKIVHAHGRLETIAQQVNQRTGIRAYRAPPQLIDGFRPKQTSRLQSKKR